MTSARTAQSDIPPPGSDEALALGCICPMLDNGHGKGFMGMDGYYIYAEGCSLHPIKADDAAEARLLAGGAE